MARTFELRHLKDIIERLEAGVPYHEVKRDLVGVLHTMSGWDLRQPPISRRDIGRVVGERVDLLIEGDGDVETLVLNTEIGLVRLDLLR